MNKRRHNPQTRKLNIILSCHKRSADDWTLQINGELHRHIKATVLESLVEGNVIAALVSLQGQRAGDGCPSHSVQTVWFQPTSCPIEEY
jgi:hypothetical protein